MDAFESVIELNKLPWYDYVYYSFTQDLEDEESRCNLIKKIVAFVVATIVFILAFGSIGYGAYCK